MPPNRVQVILCGIANHFTDNGKSNYVTTNTERQAKYSTQVRNHLHWLTLYKLTSSQMRKLSS